MATEETGYGCFNIFDAFLTDTVNYSSGAFDDWMYQSQGVPTYTAELWDLQYRAGVPDVYPRTDPITDAEAAERMYKCYQWIDENVKNNKAVPITEWTEFEHPQLGKVEIGGLDFKFTWQNCPNGYLEQEVQKNTNFCLRMAQTLPKLSIDSFSAEQNAEGVYTVTAKVRNAGYLPTFICNEAKRLKVDNPLMAALSTGAELLSGKMEESIGHLEGFSGVDSSYGYNMIRTKNHDPFVKELKWIVKAVAGTSVKLSVGNAKCGSVSAEITL